MKEWFNIMLHVSAIMVIGSFIANALIPNPYIVGFLTGSVAFMGVALIGKALTQKSK